MKNQNRNRNPELPARRFLRFEPLESRLPFAVDAVLFEVESLSMPVAESELLFAEQLVSLPNTTRNDLSPTVPFEPLRIDLAYSMPDLNNANGSYHEAHEDFSAIFAQPVAVMGKTGHLIEDVFPTDLGSIGADALFSSSGNLVADSLSAEQIVDAVFSQDWWTPAIVISQSVQLPFHSDVIDGPAIPVGESSLNSEGDASGAKPTSLFAAGSIERGVFSELLPLEHAVSGSAHSSSTNLYGELQGDASLYTLTPLKSFNSSQKTYEEKSEKFVVQAGSFLIQSLGTPNHTRQFRQRYLTLGEMLQRSGVELATESQLSIDRDYIDSHRNPQRQGVSFRTQMGIAQANAKLPFHALPEGMLSIGSEDGLVKNYSRLQNLRLNEDFVAQTAFICDDLQAVIAPNVDSIALTLEEKSSLDSPERIRWVAIGGTIIITHASLLARQSSKASIAEWLVLKLTKFKKHVPT